MKKSEDTSKETFSATILNEEQENVLDLYLTRLDSFLSEAQESENIEVETETLHLKKILTK